jgi:hypothetical protein
MKRYLSPEELRIKRLTAVKTAIRLTKNEQSYLLALLEERKKDPVARYDDDGAELVYIDMLKEVIEGTV